MELAQVALATGQSLYGLCMVVENHPEVYEALRSIVLQPPKRESFSERRERTRGDRIRRML